jgi:hypothetical protein
MKREAEEDWRRRSDAENDVRPREGTERTLQECERLTYDRMAECR